MIPSREKFYLLDSLRWVLADDNRGPELARVLDDLVLDPGEDTAKTARKALKRCFEDHKGATRHRSSKAAVRPAGG